MSEEEKTQPDKSHREFQELAISSRYLLLPKIIEQIEKREKGESYSELLDAVRARWLESLPSQKDLDSYDPQQRSEMVTKEELQRTCELADVPLPSKNEELYTLAQQYGISEENWLTETFNRIFRFHIPKHPQKRLSPEVYEKVMDLFFKLFSERYKGYSKEQVEEIFENYDLSIRPLMFASEIIKSEAIENHLPEIEQSYEEDPFGVKREENLIIDKSGDKSYYLATRKKDHDTYLAIMNVVGYCTAGCKNCYRGQETRQAQGFKMLKKDGSKEKLYFCKAEVDKEGNKIKSSPVSQIEKLVAVWNQAENPPSDILFSGGEPMDIDPENWPKIFDALKKAKHLKSLRICTGDLFLGEPLRLVNPIFLQALKDFYRDTQIPISFAVHLPHPNNMTMEVVYAIKKLEKLGIGIKFQSQTPFQEGINCFQKNIQSEFAETAMAEFTDEEIESTRKEVRAELLELLGGENLITEAMVDQLTQKKLTKKSLAKIDKNKLITIWAKYFHHSIEILYELCAKQHQITHDHPYKFIHDMQHSTSLIYSIMLDSLFSEPHVRISDIMRRVSFAAFMPKHPNLNLGFHSLTELAKVDDEYEEIDYLIFTIPAVQEQKIASLLKKYLGPDLYEQIKKEKDEKTKSLKISIPKFHEQKNLTAFLNQAKIEHVEIESKVRLSLMHAADGQTINYEEPYFAGFNDKELLQKMVLECWGEMKEKITQLQKK